MNQDEQHLNLLSIFHYVLGALSLVGGLFGGIFYMGMGTFMRSVPNMKPQDAPPPGVEAMFVVMGIIFLILGCTTGVLQLIAGSKLKNHTSRTFCFVVAALECLNMPLGTALGVFTIVVLCRPSVISLFEGQQQPTTSFPPTQQW